MVEGFEHWDARLPKEAVEYISRNLLRMNEVHVQMSQIASGGIPSYPIEGVYALRYSQLKSMDNSMEYLIFLEVENFSPMKRCALGIFQGVVSEGRIITSLKREINTRISSVLHKFSLQKFD